MIDESAALALLAQGDEEGLRWMIRRYTPYVGAVVWGIVGRRLTAQDAEEITADVFLALWQNRDKPRPGKVKGYLGAIARSRAIDAVRKTDGTAPLEEETLAVCADGPEREVLLREGKRRLRRYLDSMKPVDREIFIRHYYLCESASQIAGRLGMSHDAVRQRLKRGREYLRGLFEKEDIR